MNGHDVLFNIRWCSPDQSDNVIVSPILIQWNNILLYKKPEYCTLNFDYTVHGYTINHFIMSYYKMKGHGIMLERQQPILHFQNSFPQFIFI